MYITKADGTHEVFRSGKLVSSLRRAGAKPSEIDIIVREIESSLAEGTNTHEIYKRAFELLRASEDPAAAKYSLRRAVIGLGPTGFPFEDFLGRVFEAEGYKTKRRLVLKGKCALHEIDLAGYSPSHSFIAEAKFHAQPGIKTDLQVAMYSYARYLDLESTRICKGDECGVISLYLITNTKFTNAAIKYGACTGIKLLSWDYPKQRSLQDMIQTAHVYPVTVLTRLTNAQKQTLLQNGVILCGDIVRNPRVLDALHLGSSRAEAVLKEARLLSLP